MLRGVILPGTLSRVLEVFRPCFTAPTFETFTVLVAGLVAQPVGRTVCGMLTGAGLARVWYHGRAHRFFSAARWCPRQVGLVLAGLIVTGLLAPGAPIMVVVDDTLFRRRGKKIYGAGWFHDGSAAGRVKLGFGNTWVVAAIIVTLPFVSRPVALPVLATLALKGGAGPSQTWPVTWSMPSPSGSLTGRSTSWAMRPMAVVPSPGWATT